MPSPKPEDVKSIDAIVKALYDTISGPAGQKRDWDRFRSLFAPGAQLIALVDRPDGSRVAVRMTPDEYVSKSGKVIEERGFFEKEVKRKSEMVEDMAHVWSDYESRMKADDAKPFQTGTNGIQLYNDNKRWWIASVIWQGNQLLLYAGILWKARSIGRHPRKDVCPQSMDYRTLSKSENRLHNRLHSNTHGQI